MMSNIAHDKFLIIRSKLDNLGYRQILGIDTLALVEKLLEDLVLLKTSFKFANDELASKHNIPESIEDCIAQYKKDNSRLIKENKEAFRRIAELSQAFENTLEDINAKLNKSAKLNNELQIFNSQCLEKLRICEAETKHMENQFLNMQDQHLTAVVDINNDQNNQIPFLRPRMEINSLLPKWNINGDTNINQSKLSSAYCCAIPEQWEKSFNAHTPEVMNILKVSSERCKELEDHLHLLQKDQELSEKRVISFERQLELRDVEIERLKGLVSGGRPLESLILEQKQRQSERAVEELQAQIDLLHSRNNELEKRLLNQLNFSTASRASKDPGFLVEKASQCSIISSKMEWSEALEMLDMLEKSRRGTLTRVDELVNSQNAMILEIERLKRLHLSVANKRFVGPNSSNVVRPKAALKEKPQTVNSVPMQTKAKSILSSTVSPVKEFIEGLITDRTTLRSEVDFLTSSLRQLCSSKASTSTMTGEYSVELTRDNQNAYAEIDNNSKPTSLPASCLTLENSIFNMEEIRELEVVKKERNELLVVLNRFESQMVEIHADVEAIKSQRDMLKDQLQKAQSESQSGRENNANQSHAHFNDLPRCLHSYTNDISAGSSRFDQAYLTTEGAPKAVPASPRVNEIVNENQWMYMSAVSGVEKEEVKVLECDSWFVERDLLRQRVDHAERDRKRWEMELDAAEQNLQMARRRADDLQRRVDSNESDLERMKRELNSKTDAERNVELLQAALAQARQQLAIKTADEAEANKSKAVSESHLTKTQSELQEMQSIYCTNKSATTDLKAELLHLTKMTTQLDSEKDAMQLILDERTEELNNLKQEISDNLNSLKEKKRYITNIELRLRKVTETAAKRDQEARILIDKVHNLETTDEVIRRSRDIAEDKYQKAKDFSTTLSIEVRNYKAKLLGAESEINNLKNQLQASISKMDQLQQTHHGNHNNYKDLLCQYRHLCKDAEVVVNRKEDLERVIVQLHERLHSQEDTMKAAICRAEHAEREIRSMHRANKDLEDKLSETTTMNCGAAGQVVSLTSELEELRKDLQESRCLANELEKKYEDACYTTTQYVQQNNGVMEKLSDSERKLAKLRIENAKQVDQLDAIKANFSCNLQNERALKAMLRTRNAEIAKLRNDNILMQQFTNEQANDAISLQLKLDDANLRKTSSVATTPCQSPSSFECTAELCCCKNQIHDGCNQWKYHGDHGKVKDDQQRASQSSSPQFCETPRKLLSIDIISNKSTRSPEFITESSVDDVPTQWKQQVDANDVQRKPFQYTTQQSPRKRLPSSFDDPLVRETSNRCTSPNYSTKGSKCRTSSCKDSKIQVMFDRVPSPKSPKTSSPLVFKDAVNLDICCHVKGDNGPGPVNEQQKKHIQCNSPSRRKKESDERTCCYSPVSGEIILKPHKVGCDDVCYKHRNFQCNHPKHENSSPCHSSNSLERRTETTYKSATTSTVRAHDSCGDVVYHQQESDSFNRLQLHGMPSATGSITSPHPQTKFPSASNSDVQQMQQTLNRQLCDTDNIHTKIAQECSSQNRQASFVMTPPVVLADSRNPTCDHTSPKCEDLQSRHSPGKQFLAETSYSPAIILHEPDSYSLSTHFPSVDLNGSQSVSCVFAKEKSLVMEKRRAIEHLALSKMNAECILTDDTSESTPESGSSRSVSLKFTGGKPLQLRRRSSLSLSATEERGTRSSLSITEDNDENTLSFQVQPDYNPQCMGQQICNHGCFHKKSALSSLFH